MKIKLNDVAKLAGVSPTTVSRVINNYGHISKKTISKVRKAMQDLNYQPNSLARSLQGKGSKLIGVIFPSVSNPFYGELIEKIERKLFKNDYKMILCNSDDDPEKEKEYLKMLTANQVDGIITGSHNLGIQEYENINAPIISFDRNFGNEIPIVSSDNLYGGKLAAKAFIKEGARNIGIITGNNEKNSPTALRLNGYLSISKKNKLNTKIYQFKSDISDTFKKLQIEQIIENDNLDAIFCTDDLTALAVLNIAQKLGKDIPTELKVIGYDGSTLIKKTNPYLATVVQPVEDLADLLVELIIQKIENPECKLKSQYILPVKFHIGSTI